VHAGLPELAAELVAGDELPGARDQQGQRPRRLRFEPHDPPLLAQDAAFVVELEQAEAAGHVLLDDQQPVVGRMDELDAVLGQQRIVFDGNAELGAVPLGDR
jgi:hypothetical protein